MYDRDVVKALEREIELTSDNRFEGWCLSAAKAQEPSEKPRRQLEEEGETDNVLSRKTA